MQPLDSDGSQRSLGPGGFRIGEDEDHPGTVIFVYIVDKHEAATEETHFWNAILLMRTMVGFPHGDRVAVVLSDHGELGGMPRAAGAMKVAVIIDRGMVMDGGIDDVMAVASRNRFDNPYQWNAKEERWMWKFHDDE